jgi:hypothetical protein
MSVVVLRAIVPSKTHILHTIYDSKDTYNEAQLMRQGNSHRSQYIALKRSRNDFASPKDVSRVHPDSIDQMLDSST